jgi:hypothetical protein
MLGRRARPDRIRAFCGQKVIRFTFKLDGLRTIEAVSDKKATGLSKSSNSSSVIAASAEIAAGAASPFLLLRQSPVPASCVSRLGHRRS